MAENTTQAQHLTKLDFDVSDIPNQLENIAKQTEAYAKKISERFSKVSFDLSGMSFSEDKIVQPIQNAAKRVRQEVEQQFSEVSRGDKSLIGRMFNKEEVEKVKQELIDLLSVSERLSKLSIVADEKGNALKATSTLIDDYGRQLTEVFKLQKKEIADLETNTKSYALTWEKVGSSVTTNYEKQRKAAENNEKQIQRNIEYLDRLIEKQKDLSTKYSLKEGNEQQVRKSRELENQLDTIKKQVEASREYTESQREQTEELIKQSREYERQAKANSVKKDNSFLSSMDALKFTAVSKGAELAERAIEETFLTLKNVEDRVVEITRVFSDATVNINEYSNSIFELATGYGRSFEDASEVVLRFAQAGETASDSLELAETALIALNTAELDVENSTNSLIGIMQQWKLENEDFPLLIDKINITADSFAVTSQDLVDGLLRTSSAAKNAGISLDETIGVLTAMREASGRTGKEVGNALNTIITYTQKAQMDGTLEDLGFNVYADAAKTQLKSVIDVWEDLSKAVTSGNEDVVNALMEQTDMTALMSEEMAEYAGLSDQLREIQELEHQANQQNISDMEKQEIYEVGKTLRRNYFIALLENFNKVQEVTNNLQNAEGYSLQENASYMDTLTAKYNEFIGSLRELAQQAGESGLMDLAKATLDLATNFNKMLKSVGGAKTALTALLGIMIQLNHTRVDKWFDDLHGSVLKSGKSFKTFTSFLKTATDEMGVLKGSAFTLGTALESVTLAGWVGAGITAFSVISGAIEKARQEAEEMRQETIESAKEDENRVATLEKLQSRYLELNSITARTQEQEQELKDTYKEISEQLKGRTNDLKDLKEGSIEYTAALEKQIEAEKESLKISLQEARVASEKSLESRAGGKYGLNYQRLNVPVKELVDANGELTKFGENWKKVFGGVGVNKEMAATFGRIGNVAAMTEDYSNSSDALLDYYDKLNRLKELEEERINELSAKERATAVEAEGYQNLTEELNYLEKELGVAETAEARLKSAFAEFSGVLPETAAGFDVFIDGMLRSNGLGESFRETAESLATSTFPQLSGAAENTAQAMTTAEQKMQELADITFEAEKQFKAANDGMDELQSSFNILSAAIDEYNESQTLSVDTLQSLLSLQPSVLANLQMEDGQLRLNTESYELLIDAKVREMAQSAVRQTLGVLESMQSEKEAIEYLTGATETATGVTADFNAQLMEEASLLLSVKGWSDEASNALEGYINTIAGMAQKVSENVKSNVQSAVGAASSSARTATRAASRATKSFYDQQTEAFERLNRMGQKTTQEVVDFYRAMTKSGKVSASERLKAEEKLFDAIKKQIQEALKLQIEALNKQKKAIESAADLDLKNLEAQKEAIEDRYDSQRDYLESQKEAIEDAADAELKALDRVSKAKDREREREEYLKNRAETLEDLEAAKRRSGIDARKAEREAQKRLEELDKEYQDKLEDYKIEDQREAIEANKEAQLQAIDEQMKALESWRESSLESIEASIEKVEEQKEKDLAAIDEKIATLNEKFSESQINMLAYQAMTNEELYNQYVTQFIEPMANGMYDGFVQANDLMLESTYDYANSMREAYETNLIVPISEEIAGLGEQISATMKEFETTKFNAMDYLTGKKTHGGNKNPLFSKAEALPNNPWHANNSLTINNNNSISNWFDANQLSRKVVKDITETFRQK